MRILIFAWLETSVVDVNDLLAYFESIGDTKEVQYGLHLIFTKESPNNVVKTLSTKYPKLNYLLSEVQTINQKGLYSDLENWINNKLLQG